MSKLKLVPVLCLLSILFFPVWVQAQQISFFQETGFFQRGSFFQNLRTPGLQGPAGPNGAGCTIAGSIVTCGTDISDVRGPQGLQGEQGTPGGQSATQFVLKGITNTKATGDEGMGRFSQLCAEEVDPNSRFCPSKEVLQSINPFPSPLAEPIWVHPESPLDGDYTMGSSASCNGWSLATNNAGYVLKLQGISDGLACATPRPAACCGPAQ